MTTDNRQEHTPKILYHYCSTDTFHSIIHHGSIRLSSMSLSNDALEGKMVHRAFSELSKEYSVEEKYQSIIPIFLNTINEQYDGLALCLSEAADLLSQWRGYANDGQGFCIGFNSEYLNELANVESISKLFETPAVLKRVLYSPEDHKKEVRDTFLKMQSYIDRLAQSTRVTGIINKAIQEPITDNVVQALFSKALTLINSLFILKSPAFSEEKEWRLISTVNSESHSTGDFRTTPCNLIPYQTVKLLEIQTPAIAEVILGPKNKSPLNVVRSFLNKHGHRVTKVRQSSASYR